MSNDRFNRFHYNGYSQDIISALQRRGKLNRQDWWFSGTFPGTYNGEGNYSDFIIPLNGLKLIDFCKMFYDRELGDTLGITVWFIHGDDVKDTTGYTDGRESAINAIGSVVHARVFYYNESPTLLEEIKINLHGFEMTDDGLNWLDDTDDFNDSDFNPEDFG